MLYTNMKANLHVPITSPFSTFSPNSPPCPHTDTYLFCYILLLCFLKIIWFSIWVRKQNRLFPFQKTLWALPSAHLVCKMPVALFNQQHRRMRFGHLSESLHKSTANNQVFQNFTWTWDDLKRQAIHLLIHFL